MKYIGKKGGKMKDVNLYSDYDYSLLELGPYRINQVDDNMIGKRPTQETSIIISEASSEVIVYGEKKTSEAEEIFRPL